MSLSEKLLKLLIAEQVADLFDTTYAEITKIFYDTPKQYQYVKFEINKKNGKKRLIYAPNRKIKAIQRTLADILIDIYKQKPSVHGFCKKRSIVTNAKQHLDKKHIFNIDLKDFFPSIHFGRVKNLFTNPPFSLPHAPATVLAHICCFENSLPQGAPTSPILTNMICRKMDSILQKLSQKHNGTYTRYADDISFSFTCHTRRLPREILISNSSGIIPGKLLTKIILNNGFSINQNKVRLCTGSNRFEVTGITVNEFPNVRRKYVQQIKSMLYAWEKHGYENAESEYYSKYYIHKRATLNRPTFSNVIKGKLSFLHMVKGKKDSIYINLAKRYNKLIPDTERPLPFIEASEIEKEIHKALWILETCYDNEEGEPVVAQGTGFMLDGFGLVTCAHAVADRSDIFEKTEAFKDDNITEKYEVKVTHFCETRDLAIVELISSTGEVIKPPEQLSVASDALAIANPVSLFGYPAYKTGQTHYRAEAQIASLFGDKGIQKFEIDTQIREGNSGGPVLNAKHEVIGIAIEGARKESGNNAVVSVRELESVNEI